MNRKASMVAMGGAAALFVACSQGTVEAPGPGDPLYVPSDWVAPSLSYDADEYLPARIVDYRQAPGFYAQDATFRISGNQSKLLDFPKGRGTYGADSDSVISLGMAGGYVTLEFDPPLENYQNAADFIVYGNAYWYGTVFWQDPGTIWVREDDGVTLPGAPPPTTGWKLLSPSYWDEEAETWVELAVSDTQLETVSYSHAELADKGLDSWWPEDAASQESLTFENVLILPDRLYLYLSDDVDPAPPVRGVADASPTLKCGDLSGTGGNNHSGTEDNTVDGSDDYPGIDPVYFYTVPDRDESRTVIAGSGGGAAMDLDWALDPEQGFAKAEIASVRWIKIVSGTNRLGANDQEYSCEVDSVVRALAP